MADIGSYLSTENRFYCHQCLSQISPKLPEFVCPACDGGFIEEIEAESARNAEGGEERLTDEEDVSETDDEMFDDMPGFMSFPRFSFQAGAHNGGADILSGLLAQIIPMVTGGPRGNQGSMRMFSFPLGQGLVGNPQDYAWGPGGLDAIITQLMNQLSGIGPPPATEDQIKNLRVVTIGQEHIDKNLQCSVCFEEYKKDETVHRLPCEHLFHPDCIKPWLELHGTCPVCRKTLEGDDTSCDQNAQSIPETLENLGLNPESIQDSSLEGAIGGGSSASMSASNNESHRNASNDSDLNPSTSRRQDRNSKKPDDLDEFD